METHGNNTLIDSNKCKLNHQLQYTFNYFSLIAIGKKNKINLIKMSLSGKNKYFTVGYQIMMVATIATFIMKMKPKIESSKDLTRAVQLS